MGVDRQPRVPAGNPDGGRWTAGAAAGLKNRLADNAAQNAGSLRAPGDGGRPAPSTAELKAKLAKFGDSLKARSASYESSVKTEIPGEAAFHSREAQIGTRAAKLERRARTAAITSDPRLSSKRSK